MKICKKGEFRHISGIFGRKEKFYHKSDLAMLRALLISIFVQKNQKKLMMKSRENAQKPVFPGYFRHFRPEENLSQKSDLVMFWALLIRIFVQKIRKN